MLETAAARLASQNTADLVKLILSPVPGVGLEAIRRAGALKTPVIFVGNDKPFAARGR